MELKPSTTELDAPSGGRRRWLLNRAALEGLLSALDTDVARAAQQYERLRERLIIYFSGRRCPDPEDSADDTLDRISRRIDEGEQIRDVTRFAYAVARLVLSESFKRVRRRGDVLARLATSSGAPPDDGTAATLGPDGAMECIRSCTQRLPPDERELILLYYDSAGRDQQEQRKQLAARLDVSPTALRLRAFRIRRALEACTRDCLAGQAEWGT
jgi:DNA-directed RNA polymerase specialized sigma24 family protein